MSDDPLRYAVVGHGWRAGFYFRLARQVPSLFRCVGAVTRGESAGIALESAWDVPTYRTIGELADRAHPEVVVTCVPRSANADVLGELVGRGITTLSETPPAQDAGDLRKLWGGIGGAGLVQVAEQHPFLPYICAVRAVIDSGHLGVVSSASVSWTHDYHAVSILRSVLGVGGRSVRVQALASSSPLLDGPGRHGWADEVQTRTTAQTLALLDFSGPTGVYDFTEGQWFNPLRPRLLQVQGSLGAVVSGAVVRNIGGTSSARSAIERWHLGDDGGLEGFDLDTLTFEGQVVYRNPYRGARMSDEEIAIATCLEATAAWARGEQPAPYPLADACQDHLVGLAIHEAARAGQPVSTEVGPWSTEVVGPMPIAVSSPQRRLKEVSRS